MTGRLGDRTMEMNGGAVSYLTRTLWVPVFLLILIGQEAKGLDFQGRRGITSAVRWNLRPAIFGFAFSGSEASMVYTFLSGPMVYTLFPFSFPAKNGKHHSSFCSVTRRQATDRESRGATVVVYTLLPCNDRLSEGLQRTETILKDRLGARVAEKACPEGLCSFVAPCRRHASASPSPKG